MNKQTVITTRAIRKAFRELMKGSATRGNDPAALATITVTADGLSICRPNLKRSEPLHIPGEPAASQVGYSLTLNGYLLRQVFDKMLKAGLLMTVTIGDDSTLTLKAGGCTFELFGQMLAKPAALPAPAAVAELVAAEPAALPAPTPAKRRQVAKAKPAAKKAAEPAPAPAKARKPRKPRRDWFNDAGQQLAAFSTATTAADLFRKAG
ncbi:hypothetical protein [Deinococcus sp. Marseille-Q6407]|uniref:hypothetical protein n=1 Tax=Deinococcus sp. Marseille-Q6407 TaxID=2969223 RepID=UPI0021BF7EC4|nr:hypothetical protein [Deinococcus sp. Marseille-Q6407]